MTTHNTFKENLINFFIFTILLFLIVFGLIVDGTSQHTNPQIGSGVTHKIQ